MEADMSDLKDDAVESRRDFLRVAATGTAGLLAGCLATSTRRPGPNTGSDSDSDTDTGSVTGSGSDTGSDSGSGTETLTPTPECIETLDDMQGPFYRAGAPERTDLTDASMPAEWTRLTVSGTVLDPDCRPIAGALLDVWQADGTGAYDNVGYRFRGKEIGRAHV